MSRLDLRSTPCLIFCLQASETRFSNSSVDTSSHQQDECFPSTVRTNSTQVKEPSVTLEMYACPHTCPHTPVGFGDSLQKYYPVSSKWPKCCGTLPNPDPPPPLKLALTRATSYAEFFDELVQSRRHSASLVRLEPKAESPSVPFAAQQSVCSLTAEFLFYSEILQPIPEPQAVSFSR